MDIQLPNFELFLNGQPLEPVSATETTAYEENRELHEFFTEPFNSNLDGVIVVGALVLAAGMALRWVRDVESKTLEDK